MQVVDCPWRVLDATNGNMLGSLNSINGLLIGGKCFHAQHCDRDAPGSCKCSIMLHAEGCWEAAEAAVVKWLCAGLHLESADEHKSIGRPVARLFYKSGSQTLRAVRRVR